MRYRAFRKPFEIDDADARSVQKTPAGTVQNVLPCTFCTYVFAGQTRY
ncbi:hypothetical protein TREVI0001_2194 [Treponema vincentii ATCC 35580]|uniref:Uncharacterized protein n=1 Tax=Treponema vincentii ATCC 35580 TaxID=596324 RepID=C8PPS3_9SPIR|nr:hypothetical protein TREVI0001_2194 [Treponema vincentii ATCC 35580]